MNMRITFEQAFALHQSNRLAEAEQLYRSIVEGKPGIGNDAKPYASATHYLGIIATSTNRLDEGLQLIEKSIALRPREEEYQRNLAIALINGQRPQDLEHGHLAAQRVLANRPNDAVLWEFFARAAQARGRILEAAQAWRRVADLVPNNAGVRLNAGALLEHVGYIDAAIEDYRKALQVRPTNADGLNNLARALGAMRNPAESIVLLDHLASTGQLRPALVPLYAYMLTVHGQVGRAEAALKTVSIAEHLTPGTPEYSTAIYMLPFIAAAWLGAGELEKSIQSSEHYCALMPQDVHGLARLASSAQYAYPDDPAAHLELHQRFERDIAPSATPLPPATMTPLVGRRLRIGYVSGDIREHSVARFIEPLVGHHDKARIELHLFNTSVAAADVVTARFKAKADRWHDVAAMDDDQFARLVRDAAIDVLIDFGGHTGGARLEMFARRPAPVQVTYLGYSSTSGVAAMDGFITDPFCDPPGNEAHFSERLLRLPHVLGVYRPHEGTPDVAPPPAATNGFVTLGSVAALRKINDAVLDAWSSAMRAVPSTRLMMIGTGFSDPTLQQRFRKRFSDRGVDDGRVGFFGYLAYPQYAAIHGRIDLMLDTFPFTGHTTTVQNLWMGVPVVSFAGVSHRARMSASVLHSIGLDDFIAHREEDYGPLIARWAGDPAALAGLRSGMRSRMKASPLMDERGFARDFENLLIDAYERKLAHGHL